MSRRAGGGYRGTFGFRKRIALQGGVAATVTPVALLCATKRVHFEGSGHFEGNILNMPFLPQEPSKSSHFFHSAKMPKMTHL